MADPESFLLRVVSPAGVAVEQRVSSVVFPGGDGAVGVLPGHAPYVGTVGTGTVEYVTRPPDAIDGPRSVGVSQGVCRFHADVLELVVDGAVTARPR